MNQRTASRLAWILVGVLAVLWAAGLYRAHLLQQTVDSLNAALASTRAHHAELDAAQTAYLIDALMKLRGADVEGATRTLESALEPMVRQIESVEHSELAAAARQLVQLYGETRTSVPPDNPGLSTLTGARILPAYEGDRMSGLRLRSIESDSAFAAAGLSEGDRITAVGDLEIRTHRDAVSGMRMMTGGTLTTLRVVDASGQERSVGWPPRP